ncbi:MAG: InlB B-repeat-containing protein [Bacilli bacterium]|nr:InlB B-repeat-containing protein [Bacilli bacterium]
MKRHFFKHIISIILIICICISIFGIGKGLAEEPPLILTNALIDGKSDDVEATILDFKENNLKTDVTYHKVNGYVNFKLTIKNTTDTQYKLKYVNDNSENNNIKYEYNYQENQIISPHSTIDISLKATYISGVTNINDRNQNLEVIISIIAENENGQIIINDINVNPKTNDNIIVYLGLLIISSSGLLIIIKNKKIKKLLVIALLMTPVLTKAVSASLTITLNGSIKLLDKVAINTIVNGEKTTELIDYNTIPQKPATIEIPGYEFENWYVGDEVYNFDAPLTQDIDVIAKYKLLNYDITYNLDGGSALGNPDKYNVETDSFDLINPEKPGYTFTGWTGSNGENLQTRVTIEKGSTGNKTYTAHYSVNPNISYKVIHKYKTLTGTYEEEIENLTGAAGTTVYPAFKPKTGFINPAQKSLTIKGDGTSFIEYEYERETYSLIVTEDVETTFTEPKYPYKTEITLKAKDKEHYDFEKWSNNSTNKTLVFEIVEDTEIYPIYKPKKYTVSFNTHGGVEVDSITKDYNQQIDTLPTTSKTGYTFAGWYTDENYETKVTEPVTVTGNVTYHAKWENYKCVPARTLHKSTCKTNGGCISSGYTNNQTIVFGQKPNSDELSPGFAYDCDVDGDGNFSQETERFYLLRTKGENAVLISHSNFEGEAGQKAENIFVYDEAIEKLPTVDQWKNMPEMSNGKAARFIQYDDLVAACGDKDFTKEGALDSCNFILENTRYVSPTTGRTALWIEKSGDELRRIFSTTRNVLTVTSASKDAARPVIEVPLELIKPYNPNADKYTITFDSVGGTNIDSIQIEDGKTIDIMPIPSKDNYAFAGWYTDTDYSTQITPLIPIDSDMTLYAKWIVDPVAEVDGIHYESMQDAINAVQSTSEPKTIKLIKDISDSLSISAGKNIIFNLQNHTISNSSSTVIENNGTLKITNGTVTCSAGSGAINNNQDATLTIENAKVIATGTRQAIYNDGGTLLISDDAYLESSSNQRATVQNTSKAGGNITITGGTIISKNQHAISNANQLVIGSKDGTYNIQKPVIQGKIYGLTSTVNISIYDGIIKGENAPLEKENKITQIEEGAIIVKGTETIEDIVYNTLYYTLEP